MGEARPVFAVGKDRSAGGGSLCGPFLLGRDYVVELGAPTSQE